jgi:hypothetical protein
LSGVPLIDERVGLPLGVPWWLTLHDGGGIAFDQGRQGTGVRIGPIGPTEAPIAIDAAFDCSVPRGVLRVDGAIVGPTGAPASPGTANGPVAATFPGDSPAVTPPPDAPARPTWTNPAILLVVGFAAVALLLGASRKRGDRR